MTFKAHITIMPHDAILDPQGKTVCSSLKDLHFSGVQSVRIGKHMVLEIESDSKKNAFALAEDACKKLLANQIMEKYEINIEG